MIASTRRDSTERISWLARRNAALTRHNGALEDTNQRLVQLLAGVALVAGNAHPDVAREIVAIVEEVTLTEPVAETSSSASGGQARVVGTGSVSVIPANLNELLAGP